GCLAATSARQVWRRASRSASCSTRGRSTSSRGSNWRRVHGGRAGQVAVCASRGVGPTGMRVSRLRLLLLLLLPRFVLGLHLWLRLSRLLWLWWSRFLYLYLGLLL